MRFRLAVLLAILSGAPAHAEPIAQFGFTLGTRAVCVVPAFDAPLSAGGEIRVSIGVTGLEFATRGYRAAFEIVAQDGLDLPDAWRFDVDGCQSSAWTDTDFLPPPIETGCRSLVQGFFSASNIRAYDPGTKRLRVDLAVELSGVVTAPNPQSQYFVASVPFHHYASMVGSTLPGTSCGGVERAVCIRLISLAIEDESGHWTEAARPTSVITVNGASLGGPTACGAVAARAATWGAVRAHYR